LRGGAIVHCWLVDCYSAPGSTIIAILLAARSIAIVSLTRLREQHSSRRCSITGSAFSPPEFS
jgi:hypothetical protein